MTAVVMEPDPAAWGGTAPERGSLRTSVALEGTAGIAEARRTADAFLDRARSEHGVFVAQRARDLTRLVVSELVTNAHKYAPGPALMDLHLHDGTVEVAVWDSGPALPIARAADAGRVGQHGLEIVMAVAQGFEARREPVGKRIIVRLSLEDDPHDVTPARRLG
ncbi:anti-sigma regulatory factor (Ser/Thr protein kinase) [Streptomyces sp. BK208]|nr:anti-sigma regulatory factor (Ser/Thr protein kinase) [Streptomyces sp. BK208]